MHVYNEIKDKKKEDMNILLDPNISYLILVGGLLLAFLALFAPGTGLLEIGAIVAIMFSGYFIANLPVNWWASTRSPLPQARELRLFSKPYSPDAASR